MSDPIQVLIDQIARDALLLKKLYQPVVPPDPGTVIRVTTADEFATALASVTGPAEIRLAPGTYTGNFVLPQRPDSARVIVRADLDDAALTPTTTPWILPAQAAEFPRLVPADPGRPILACEDSTSGWTLWGLAIGPNNGRPDMTLLELGRGDITSAVQAPADVIVDGCYIHGDPAVGCRRGVSLQSTHTTIRRCYISDCWYRGQDAQAIACWTSPGNLRIEDNYLAGSGENLIIGGADPRVANLVPTDIVIRGNYLYKPVEWRQYGGSVKNSLELKCAQKVLIENNVIENCWVDGQPGHSVVFTVRNQDGGAPWATVQDVTMQYNVIGHVEGSFFNILGIDNNHPCVRGSGLTIQHNLCLSGGGGFQILSGFGHTNVAHNTVQGPDWKFLSLGGEPMPAGEFRFCDNAVGPSEYGVTGDDCGIGQPSLDRYAPGATFTQNAIGQCAGTWVPYPAGNTLVPEGSAYGEYCKVIGTDGQPAGVDLDELQARIPWWTVETSRRTACF